MKRLTTLVVFAALAAAISGVATAAPILKSTVRVDAPHITLGDLFEGAGDKANVVVAMAPLPGQRGLLNVSHIAMVARNNDLGWRGGTGITQVIIHRTSRIVPTAMIEDAISVALSREGLEVPVDISLRNLGVKLHVEIDTVPSVSLRDLDLNRHTGYFAATLVAPANDPNAKAIRVVGQAHRLAEIPVLVRKVAVGSVIRAKDIDWISVRAKRVHRNIARAEEEIVGMSPRRPLRVGAPIRASDVSKPVTVAKGAVVTMQVAAGRLQLSAGGRALEAGAVGDVIRVSNIKSHRVVLATIISPNHVAVAAAQKVLTAAQK